MIAWVLAVFTNKTVKALTGQLVDAMAIRGNSVTEIERIEADKHIAQIQAMRDIAVSESQFVFSATRIGRLLIVVPYGLWWTAIFIDSTFTMPWDVQAIPSDINEMAKYLIPAILLSDVVDRTFRGGRN